ncbi:MAG: SDR family oxidoreductase [Chloroflexota bacterium]
MADTGKVLVTGATGNTCSILVPALVEAGVDVRAFVRDEAKAQSLRDMGVEVVIGDLDRPETIGPALEGVDKIYLLTWNGPTQEQQAKNVIQAAQEAGDPHIVRHSMWGSENSRIIQQGLAAEEALKESGLPWTILKPTFFMQNLMLSAQTVAEDGMLYWDLGDAELAMIDIRDVADAAFATLTGSGHQGKSYILTGPEAVSLHDTADAFSDVLNEDVNYVAVPHEASLEAMLDMGFPEWIARGYGELMEGFLEGFAEQPTDDVQQLTGHPPRSIHDFARDFAGVFGGKN